MGIGGIARIEVVGLEVGEVIMMLDHSIVSCNFTLIFITPLIMKFLPRFILTFLK